MIVPFKKGLYEDVLEGVRGVALTPPHASASTARARGAMRGLIEHEAAAVERCAGRADARPGDGLGGGQQRLAQPRRAGARSRRCSPTPSRRLPGELALREPAPVEAIGGGRRD